ncbi:MAG: DUF1700 domain-containing protein [Lachnospiraceae bacterium]|nr:DUF1700 domain-containing protein [Lachnospiraceae bacterium]
MTRQEFLQELRFALQGQLSQAAINENIRYYDNYIIEEVRKGSSEEMVIGRLGSPRLIAKTLIDTTDSFGRAAGREYYAGSYGQPDPGGGTYMDDSVSGARGHFRLGAWYGKLLLVALAVLVIVVVANVIAFLLPILVPLIIIFLVYSLFFGNKR